MFFPGRDFCALGEGGGLLLYRSIWEIAFMSIKKHKNQKSSPVRGGGRDFKCTAGESSSLPWGPLNSTYFVSMCYISETHPKVNVTYTWTLIDDFIYCCYLPTLQLVEFSTDGDDELIFHTKAISVT